MGSKYAVRHKETSTWSRVQSKSPNVSFFCHTRLLTSRITTLKMGNKPPTRVGLLVTRRQVSNEALLDATLMRKRKTISKYLKRIGKDAKLDLSLDAYGFCYIPFKKFLIIIGVPDDDNGLLHFQTMIFDLDSASGITKVHKRIAAANLTDMSLGKFGSHLHMEGDEISLALTTRIKGLGYRAMTESLEDFMETALTTNRNLVAIR
jgi:hypothetical protein